MVTELQVTPIYPILYKKKIKKEKNIENIKKYIMWLRIWEGV